MSTLKTIAILCSICIVILSAVIILSQIKNVPLPTQPPTTKPKPQEKPSLNISPIAEAGSDQTILEKKQISFDGSSSNDPDGSIISYHWNFGDGTSEENGVKVTHVYNEPGKYIVTLTVIDNNGATNSDTCSVTVTYIDLKATTSSSNSWYRDPGTDLPKCTITITYSISNRGTAIADLVDVSYSLDGKVTNLPTILNLGPGQVSSNLFSLTTNYYDNTVSIIEISARAWDSYSLSSTIWDTRFPRSPNPSSEYAAMFITPNDPVIKNKLNDIIKNKGILQPDLWAIRDWVGENIAYPYPNEYDDVIHGQPDYWQFSRETISLGTGDCEDYSILLASLLRAKGYTANDVYVMMGYNKTDPSQGHAWIIVKELGIWWTIEPQATTSEGVLKLISNLGQLTEVSGYKAKYKFNDEQQYTLP